MPKYLRLRMENCVATILEINQHLGDGRIRPEIIHHFERLVIFLKVVSEENVSEEDIDRIEEATNHLLDEIRCNTRMRRINYHHQGPIN